MAFSFATFAFFAAKHQSRLRLFGVEYGNAFYSIYTFYTDRICLGPQSGCFLAGAETGAAAFEEWRRAKTLLDLKGAPEWVKEDFALLDLLARAVKTRLEEPEKPNFRAMFEPEYRRLWLRQNRLGGLKDSLAILFGM